MIVVAKIAAVILVVCIVAYFAGLNIFDLMEDQWEDDRDE